MLSEFHDTIWLYNLFPGKCILIILIACKQHAREMQAIRGLIKFNFIIQNMAISANFLHKKGVIFIKEIKKGCVRKTTDIIKYHLVEIHRIQRCCCFYTFF